MPQLITGSVRVCVRLCWIDLHCPAGSTHAVPSNYNFQHNSGKQVHFEGNYIMIMTAYHTICYLLCLKIIMMINVVRWSLCLPYTTKWY